MNLYNTHVDPESPQQVWQMQKERFKAYKEPWILRHMRTMPGVSEQVLQFIGNFTYHSIPDDASPEMIDVCLKMIHNQYANGYCWYFAHMLLNAFERGYVAYLYDAGHFVWVDDNGVAYDIDGVNVDDDTEFLPEEFIKEALSDFKHIDGEIFNATDEWIVSKWNEYLQSLEEDSSSTKCVDRATWCREHAPDAIKHYPINTLLELMNDAYNREFSIKS